MPYVQFLWSFRTVNLLFYFLQNDCKVEKIWHVKVLCKMKYSVIWQKKLSANLIHFLIFQFIKFLLNSYLNFSPEQMILQYFVQTVLLYYILYNSRSFNSEGSFSVSLSFFLSFFIKTSSPVMNLNYNYFDKSVFIMGEYISFYSFYRAWMAVLRWF